MHSGDRQVFMACSCVGKTLIRLYNLQTDLSLHWTLISFSITQLRYRCNQSVIISLKLALNRANFGKTK